MPRARAWERCSNRELLQWRICDLGIQLEGSGLETQIERLYDELDRKSLRLKPHCWLSEEWFTPDGVPGIASPFYLAHPRLKRLERSQILEVEGGTPSECIRLLRHEAGHAIQNAFRLHRRKRWREHFGSSTEPYPDFYRPNPGSRRYVIHLPNWYAQAHPAEDFAETFAVWLTPGSRWRRKYLGWPALRKLRYVDQLMHELAGQAPPVRSKAKPDPVHRIKATLGEYYRAKRERYRALASSAYDQDLLRFFTPIEESTSRSPSAAAFLRSHRAEIRQMVARATGKHELALDAVLGEMIARCRELKLRAVGRKRELVVDFAILLAARSTEFLIRGGDWHAL